MISLIKKNIENSVKTDKQEWSLTMENIVVNRLPAKTWYWLNVNEAAFEWDKAASVELEKTLITSKATEPVRIDVTGDNDYTEKYIDITADDNEKVVVYINCKSDKHMAVHTNISAGNNSNVKLVLLNYTGSDALLYNEVKGECKDSATIEAVEVFLGKGDVYSDFRVDLSGDKSALKMDIGYVGRDNQTIDINVFANHLGKKTESEINVNGALKDAAKKTFKGTIDFKRGAADSVGNEQENVLLLGDDIVNKTIPLILCAEENVVGNHGASIGELDEDTLFYFESRGIDKSVAENILARASIERLTRLIDDSSVVESIEKELEEVL